MVKVTGVNVISSKLKGLAGRGKDGEIGKALVAGGELIADTAELSITTGSSSGRKTKKYLHIPSRPGEPPNNDTDYLKNNIEVVQIEPLAVEVSSNAEYSAALELGTSKMEPRPFMGPAVAANKDKVIALVGKAVEHILAGGRLG